MEFSNRQGKATPDTKKYYFNIIDTPDTLTLQLKWNGLCVYWMAYCVIFCCRWCRTQSETVWRQANRYGVPELDL
jgi:elongation factor G